MERIARGPSTRLVHYLIVKSIAEVLFVGALAIVFYLTAFAPVFQGSLDVADSRHIAGWVINRSSPAIRVEVQLYIDGRFVGNQKADSPRPDVKAAGRAQDELHGFVFETPALPVGAHEARVYAVHSSGKDERRTLQLIGAPTVFSVSESDIQAGRTSSAHESATTESEK